MSNIILPCASELINDHPYELYTLKVPTSWQQVAISLTRQRSQYTNNYPSIPVKSLDPIIYGSFPNIIHVARKAWKYNNKPWIFSQKIIDTELLSYVIKDWLEDEFNDALGEDSVRQSLNNLKAEDWQWDDESISYSLINPNEDHLYPDIRFNSVPDYLVTEFLKNPTINFGKDGQYPLKFYRVVKLNSNGELMSWPPELISIKTKEDYKTFHISFVIRFTLQTVPWRKKPLITYQLSVRRWITEFPKNKFPYNGITAFVGDKMRWLDGEYQPFSFIPLQVKRIGKDHQWPRVVNKLLKTHNTPLPKLDELLNNPVYNWSKVTQQIKGFQIAISYDNRHLGISHCSPGVTPLDYAMLDQAIQERLPLERVGKGIKIAGNKEFWQPGPSKKKDDKTPKNPNELDPVMLRPNIAAPAVFSLKECPLKTILIVWETEECKDALIKEICQRLCLTSKEETVTYNKEIHEESTLYRGEFGEICIKTQHVQELTEKLEIDPKQSRTNQRIDLLQKRAKEIADSLPPTQEISGALVEIKDQIYFSKLPESDPKLAWRIGAAKAYYLNQHLHKITYQKDGKTELLKNAQHRIQRSVSDLLRQFGVFPLPSIQTLDPKKKLEKLDNNLWLTCLYVLRKTRKTNANNSGIKVVVIVRVNPITGTVEMANSLSYNKFWQPYSQGLQTLLNLKWDGNSSFEENTSEDSEEQSSQDKNKEKNVINQFITNCLRECLSEPLEENKKPNVLFMVEAQNSRQVLPCLNNNKLLPPNHLPKEIKLQESEKERLQIVRLRTAKNGEVPFPLVQGGESLGSKTTGVFEWNNVCDPTENSEQISLFLSLRKPLTTEQGLLKTDESRLDNGNKPAPKIAPLEIAIIYNPEMENEKLATLIHYLRTLWPYFSDNTALPFPFPFATKAKEYAISYQDELESEPIEEDEEQGEEETINYIQLNLFN